MIYLDNAATTPVIPAALEAAWPWLTTQFGNPSSTHELGHAADQALEKARSSVATFFGCKASEVVFTSGGTEGDNLAIIGLSLAHPRGRHIISVRTEHEAVLKSVEYLKRVHGFEVSWLPTNHAGEISLEDLRQALREDTTLVTVMVANNEIGTIHPIPEIAELAQKFGALIHTDAVQAVGWMGLNFPLLNVDALTISGHKFGSPKGSGATIIRSRLALEPLIHGGGQEFERRSGTENVAWAVALATALENLSPTNEEFTRVHTLRQQFIETATQNIPEAQLSGSVANCHPAIVGFTFPGLNGETLLLELEQRGIIVSSGSACAAGSDEPSHVLMACGFSEDQARTAVRFSFSHSTTSDELHQAANALRESVETLRQLGRG